MLVDGVDAPGGLAFDEDGSLLVGFGNSIPGGTTGNLSPMAGLLRVDIRTGEAEPAVEGLAMANGLATGPDGAIYASDDFGTGIDRVVGRRGRERLGAAWSHRTAWLSTGPGRYLYAAQTFQPAAIVKVPIADPASASTYVQAPPGDTSAGPDGMTRDGLDRLYVAANGAGQIWRVNRRREICSLAETAPLGPSAVSFGRGRRGPFPQQEPLLRQLPGPARGAEGRAARPALAAGQSSTTLKRSVSADLSTLPASSIARTLKLWLPSSSRFSRFGDVHDLNGFLSILHSKVDPGSSERNL